MNRAHLTACLIQEPEHVNTIMETWTKSQLVSNVATCEMSRITEDGFDTPCRYFDSTTSSVALELTLQEVLLGQPTKTTLTLAAFRNGFSNRPYSDGDLPDIRSLLALERHLGRGIEVRNITVGVSLQQTGASFPAGWDMHLVHDSTSLALPTILHGIESSDVPGLCAVMAMCAGAGWSFSDGIILTPTEADRRMTEDSLGCVRIVRPEVRIVAASSLDAEIAEITQSRFVRLPPWPKPPCGHVVSDSIPVRVETVIDLAESCSFWVDDDIRYYDFSELELRDTLNIVHAARTLWLRQRGFAVVTDDTAAETQGILDAIQHFKARHSESLVVTDLESAVEGIVDSGFPGLKMGMDVASRAPQPWRKVRDLFFGLIDGGPLPKGVEDLGLPLDAEAGQRAVWAHPKALAPSPFLNEGFRLDGSSGALVASAVGINTIEPLDVLHCRRVDAIIRSEEDPFPYVHEKDRPDFKDQLANNKELRDDWSDLRSRWTGWLESWRHYPLSVLSDVLGEAVETAYENFVETIRDPMDDDYTVERYSFRYGPLMAVLAVFGIGAGLFAWRLAGNGGPVPTAGLGLYVALAAWIAVLTLLSWIYQSYRMVLDRRGVMSIRNLERSQEARHYASEVFRLYGLGNAFMDHQRMVRVLLYEPFGSQDGGAGVSDVAVEEKNPHGQGLGANSILYGLSEMSDRQKEILESLSTDDIFHDGWLSGAYEQTYNAWMDRYKSAVGSESFDLPDDDYWMPGEVYRDDAGQKLMRAREDLCASIVKDSGLRTAGRVRIAKKFVKLVRDEVDSIEQVGSVRIRRYPAFSGSGSSFVEFADSNLAQNDFDARILRDAGDVPVSVESTIGSVAPVLVRDVKHGQTMFVSWRMLVSDAYGANRLRCVADEEETRHSQEHFDADPYDPEEAPEI